ncbi:MAG TPA: hypothetical protein VFX17_04435 [Patescibacteria group bacterium]|nr:hypothetical protein [Patescibacteria group bacterium]
MHPRVARPLPRPIDAVIVGNIDCISSARVRTGQKVEIIQVYEDTLAYEVKANGELFRLGTKFVQPLDENDKDVLEGMRLEFKAQLERLNETTSI